MSMHPDTLEALDMVDASIFSGDCFMHKEGRMKLREYLARWNKWDQEHCYYAPNGTLLNADGTRSIFDDVDE